MCIHWILFEMKSKAAESEYCQLDLISVGCVSGAGALKWIQKKASYAIYKDLMDAKEPIKIV